MKELVNCRGQVNKFIDSGSGGYKEIIELIEKVLAIKAQSKIDLKCEKENGNTSINTIFTCDDSNESRVKTIKAIIEFASGSDTVVSSIQKIKKYKRDSTSVIDVVCTVCQNKFSIRRDTYFENEGKSYRCNDCLVQCIKDYRAKPQEV